MKREILLLALFVALIGAACGSLNSLHSTTYIEPLKSFELGDGQHGSFTARVKNASKVNIEIRTQTSEEAEKSVAVLKPNERINLTVAKNTSAIFKNASATQAAIELVVTGDIGLSMGYQKDK